MSTVEIVKSDLESGNFKLTKHALERLGERTVTRQDIIEAAQGGDVIEAGDDKFALIGFDSAGDDLTVICGYDDGTLIITVY